MFSLSRCHLVLFLLFGSILILPEDQASAQRVPVPSKAEREKRLALVKDLYHEEFLAAKTDDAKSKLAASMLAEAAELTDDAPAAYVLMRVARDIAIGANDVQTAFDAIEQMSKRFDEEPVDVKLIAATTIAKAAAINEQRKAVAEASLEILGPAIAAYRYQEASRLADVAATAARRARELELARQLNQLAKEADRLAKSYELVQAAMAKLSDRPDDPEANRTVGEFVCFTAGDWPKGLPYLALSGDETLTDAAARDLAEPTDWKSQIAIADSWWDVAQQKDEPAKTHVLRRAAHWYRLAQQGAQGLLKAKTDQRLAEIAKQIGDATDGSVVKGSSDPPKVSFKAVKTNLLGNDRHTPFVDLAPKGGYLVGMRVIPGTAFGGNIDALQPVYRTGKKTITGKAYGKGRARPIDLIAKPDYAVGEIRARTGLIIDGFKLAFMRVTDDGLDPNDSYESPWVGGTGAGEKLLTANGNMIVGIYGSVSTRLEGLGLIVRQRVLEQASDADG